MVMIMWLGLLIPFFGTTLGSAIVYFIKNKKNELLSRCFSGIASGVMVAASIWSLLIPAMEQEKNIRASVLTNESELSFLRLYCSSYASWNK